MDKRIFNEHTGAACGLIIGIILGCVALEPVRLGSLIQSLTESATQYTEHATAAARHSAQQETSQPHQAASVGSVAE